MKTQSSAETRSRAKRLAEEIGAYFLEADIDEVRLFIEHLRFSLSTGASLFIKDLLIVSQ